MEQTIEQVHPTPIHTWMGRDIEDFRVIGEPGRWGWRLRLAKLSWWLLRKLGVQLQENRTSWKTVSFNTEKVLEKIRLSRSDLARIWHRQCDTILISPEFMDDVEIEVRSPPLMFDCGYSISMGEEHKIFDMRVVVCPWIRGWALLPQEVSRR